MKIKSYETPALISMEIAAEQVFAASSLGVDIENNEIGEEQGW